jgi:hypothetical protein
VDPSHLHEAAERVHKALLKQFPHSNQGGRNAQKSLPQGHYHLFISYRVNTDSQIADFLYWYLKNKGWEPFMDKYCLEDGELWKSGFVDGLRNSCLFVPIISSAALANLRKDKPGNHMWDNLLIEYQMALAKSNRHILPLFMGERLPNKRNTFSIVHYFDDFRGRLYADCLDNTIPAAGRAGGEDEQDHQAEGDGNDANADADGTDGVDDGPGRQRFLLLR